MNPIPKRERRDYKRAKKLSRTKLNLALGTVTFLLIFVAQPYMNPVIARGVTPKKDYPHTDRGTCSKFHDYGGTLVRDHLKEAVEWCAKQGVDV